MAAWREVERAEPEFAQRARKRARKGGESFRADITAVVHTHLNDQATMLVVEWWTPAHGLRRIERG